MRKRLFWYHLQQSFFYKTVPQISFNLFCLGDKRYLLDFMKKWHWIHGHDVCFPRNLGSRLTFQKTETRFCRCKSNDYNDINISLFLQFPCTVLLVKEKTWKRNFKTNCHLSQNHTEKQFMPFIGYLII